MFPCVSVLDVVNVHRCGTVIVLTVDSSFPILLNISYVTSEKRIMKSTNYVVEKKEIHTTKKSIYIAMRMMTITQINSPYLMCLCDIKGKEMS
jgi:hypothetical protein